MNYYNVPQDVEVADQVVGPLSLKQFFFMLAGIGFGVGFYVLLTTVRIPAFFAVVVAIIPTAFFFALAFIPYNSRPLDYYVFPLFQYYTSERLLIWKKEVLGEISTLDSIAGSIQKAKSLKTKKVDPNEVIDTGIESKRGVRQELSHIKKMAALLDGGIEELTEDYIMADEDLIENPQRNQEINRALSAAALKVANTREPAISQVATLRRDKSQDYSLPDLSAYSFSDMEVKGSE